MKYHRALYFSKLLDYLFYINQFKLKDHLKKILSDLFSKTKY
jgi:hypothetical protein